MMTNHPNRSRDKSQASNPSTDQIVSARNAVGYTQKQAAEKIMHSVRTWEKWETGERRMHPALFDYFLLKTGQKTLA